MRRAKPPFLIFKEMFTKEEKRAYNHLFWGKLKKEMDKVRSKSGKRIQWLNYPTKIKFIFLRLETHPNHIAVCFDIQPKDEGIQAIIWEQMVELKVVLQKAMKDEDEIWIKNKFDFTKGNFSRIEWRLENVNYYDPKDEEKIIRFYKEKLIGFDEFYTEYGEILILLAK